MLIVHPFEPFIGNEPKILILGSFPSVKSRETGFYYGNSRNRFWQVIAGVFDLAVPQKTEEKKTMLDRCGIALWDTVFSCEISGSSDSTIKNVTPNNISPIIEKYGIKAVFCNGKTAGALYAKYVEPQCGMKAHILPSTSPANAAMSAKMLINAYSVICEFI